MFVWPLPIRATDSWSMAITPMTDRRNGANGGPAARFLRITSSLTFSETGARNADQRPTILERVQMRVLLSSLMLFVLSAPAFAGIPRDLPEPSTIALLCAGVGAAIWLRGREKK